MNGLSIIICCYNSADRLPKVLGYLAGQKIEAPINWEVLIIDNASKDHTSALAIEIWDQSIAPLRVIHEPEPGLSNARKTGLNNAKYHLVSFVDDDNWVENEWVQKVYNLMSSNPKIALLGGKGEAVIDGVKPVWFDKIQRAFAVGPQGEHSGISSRVLYGAGFSLRKTAWDSLHQNGFEFILSGRKGLSLTSGEDSELCYALMLSGYELYYEDSLDFKHYMPNQRIDWKYVIKLYQAFGRSAPVLNIYKTLTKNTPATYNRIRIQNRWIRILLLLYSHLSTWPSFFKAQFSDTTGKQEVLRFHYTKYAFLEMLEIFPIYPSLISQIENGKWINSSINELA